MSYNATDVYLAQLPGYRPVKTPSAGPPSPKPQVPPAAKPEPVMVGNTDPAGFQLKMREYMKYARSARQSLKNRYSEGYYDTYHGDTAQYASGFYGAKSRLNSQASSLLNDIEALRTIYGDQWAKDTINSVNSAIAQINGYSDTVKNDVNYWSQFENDADYGAAMFNSGAETGDEFKQLVEKKNGTASPGGYMDQTSYALAMNAKNNTIQAQGTLPKTPDEQRRYAEAMLAKKQLDPYGYAIVMQAKNKKSINESKPITAATPSSEVQTTDQQHKHAEAMLAQQQLNPNGYAIAMQATNQQKAIGDAQALLMDIEQLKLQASKPFDINNKDDLRAYGYVSDRIKRDETQLKQLVEENAGLFIFQNFNRWIALAQKDYLTPAERQEALLAVTALRKSVSDIDYGFGDAYDPEKNSKKLSYNKLADILGNKANELNAVKYGAASTIPDMAQSYEEIQNSPMMHEVNNFYMDPAVSQIANGYNPIEDTQKNYPVYYSLGVAGGTAAQTALNSAASKVLGAAGGASYIPKGLAGGSLVDELDTAASATGSNFYNQLMKYWKSIMKPVSKAFDNDLELPHLAGNSAKGYTEGAGDVTYSPINPGPLENKIASTFRSSTYTKKVLTEDTVFYRVYGGNAEIAGNYVSRTPQMGGLQSQLDLALVPEWGNTATYVTKVTVPKGTVIYEGVAAPQTMNGGAGMLMGGGNQIYIPEARFNPSWFGN